MPDTGIVIQADKKCAKGLSLAEKLENSSDNLTLTYASISLKGQNQFLVKITVKRNSKLEIFQINWFLEIKSQVKTT